MKIEFPEPLKGFLGLEQAAVTNFFGAPGTGKTNISIIAAVRCIGNGGKVVYIDTEGGFSLERLSQIVEGSGLSKDVNTILKSIILIEPKSFEEQGKAIRKLEG